MGDVKKLADLNNEQGSVGVCIMKDYWADDGGNNGATCPGTVMIDLITGPIWGWVTKP